MDGTVTLDSPAANQFTITTGESSADIGSEVEFRTDGRLIVAPQTRGPTLTDAVITLGSWNNNKCARLEFSWPNQTASDYAIRAGIRKDGVNSDLVYAHYNVTVTEEIQNGHVFYSNISVKVGVGNKLLVLRETETTIKAGRNG